MTLPHCLIRTGAGVFCAAAVWAADEPTKLEGAVSTSDGVPVGNALVIIYSAAPRDGGTAPCPTCCPDCGKRTRTDAQGRFSIAGVKDDSLYRLLVAAAGFRPDYIKDADPLYGGASLRLKPLKTRYTKPENRVSAKLIDPKGRPVGGARIEVSGTRFDAYSYYGSTSGRVDPMAVSDENGEFFLDCTNGIAAITVSIEPRGLARRRMWLDTGKAHLIRLKDGVSVTGRLVREGKPLPGAAVSMSTQERESSVFMRGFDGSTDTEGRFRLGNIPADNRYFLYTRMKDMRELGAGLKPQPVTTGADGATIDLGDLEVRPAHALRGRVVTSDAKPLPARTRIYLSLENAWDTQDTYADADGWFEFNGVPADEIDLSVRVSGYRVSAKNPNKDWLNEGRLLGRLEGDLEEFIIHLERGDRFTRDQGPPDSERYPRGKPLRGAKLD
jgi:hypothetical protein